MKVDKLLIKLIRIKSPSGNEHKIGEYVFNFLKEEGFNIRKVFVDKNRFNIVAKLGSPKIFFSTHLDTVATSFPIKVTKSEIYGRGACDAKASLAAMVWAAIESKKRGLTDFGLIFTVGEETNFIGVRKILKSGFKIPFVIIGEPTRLDVVNGHFGVLVLKLIAKGKKAHSSEPEKGVNAIDKLIKAIGLVKTMKIHKKSFFNFCQIEGGVADNIIPDRAESTITFRIFPIDKTDYNAEIKKKIKNLAEVKKTLSLKGLFTKMPKEMNFIKERRTVKYGTELSFYKKGVVLGPGDIRFAHGNKEMVKKSELKKAVDIYKKIIVNYNS